MKKLILLFCFSVFLVGCATKSKIPFPSTTLENKIEGEEKAKISEKLLNLNKEFSNVRLLSDVMLVEKDSAYNFRYLFIYDKKGKVRIEAFPPQTFLSLHILTQNEKGALFLDRQQKIAIKTKDIKNILNEIWSENIEYNNLISIFIGNNNFSKDSLNDFDFYLLEAKKTNDKILQVIRKDKNEYYEFNYNDLSLLTYDIWKNNGDTLLMRIKNVKDMIYVMFPQKELLMNFKITKEELNANLKDSLFSVKVPSNYKVYNK